MEQEENKDTQKPTPSKQEQDLNEKMKELRKRDPFTYPTF